MRTLISATVASLVLVGALTTTSHAYVNGAAPAIVSFTCNSGGTVTITWNMNAGKPTEYALSRTNPTPIASVRDRVPGSRGSKGSYTLASSFNSPGYVIEATLYNRAGATSNTVSATCP